MSKSTGVVRVRVCSLNVPVGCKEGARQPFDCIHFWATVAAKQPPAAAAPDQQSTASRRVGFVGSCLQPAQLCFMKHQNSEVASLPNRRSPRAHATNTRLPAKHSNADAANAWYQPATWSAPPAPCSRYPVTATPTMPASVPAVLLMPLHRGRQLGGSGVSRARAWHDALGATVHPPLCGGPPMAPHPHASMPRARDPKELMCTLTSPQPRLSESHTFTCISHTPTRVDPILSHHHPRKLGCNVHVVDAEAAP